MDVRTKLLTDLPATAIIVAVITMMIGGGCALAPDVKHRERFHNPLPQLHRIAILPFFNQSSEPSVDQIEVAEAYFAELQSIPGFEVMPIGVSATGWEQYLRAYGEPMDGAGFQELARFLGVDAIVVGSVTDFSPYSPPRMGLAVRWYAANPGFHPVPAGYGLPWGTKAEKNIPRSILLETELEVARAQLATQTPKIPQATYMGPEQSVAPEDLLQTAHQSVQQAAQWGQIDPRSTGQTQDENTAWSELAVGSGLELPIIEGSVLNGEVLQRGPLGSFDPASGAMVEPLPDNWPNPTRLIPASPQPVAPSAIVQTAPILSHTRIYRGDDLDVTEKLADYVYARDAGSIGGWQSYLTRSDDFIRFCCYLHITEMIEMRGGRNQSDLIFRWPISRYWR